MTKFNIAVHVGGYVVTRNTEDGPVESWQETFGVVATSPRGEVWALIGGSCETQAEAEFNLRILDHTPATQPDAWYECSPVYGSEAWGPEAEYELACFEADAFDEPRPHW